jgi:hypothetical protein
MASPLISLSRSTALQYLHGVAGIVWRERWSGEEMGNNEGFHERLLGLLTDYGL